MQNLPENPPLSQLEKAFEPERFATHVVGCRIVEGRRGYGVCELNLTDMHYNSLGSVMGGAIFTLADFALSIACNTAQPPTVSVDHAINFMKATSGTKLIATAECTRKGKHLSFYTIDVIDDEDKHIARMSATCYNEHIS